MVVANQPGASKGGRESRARSGQNSIVRNIPVASGMKTTLASRSSQTPATVVSTTRMMKIAPR